MTVAAHLTLNELWRRVKTAKDPIEKHRFLAVYHAKGSCQDLCVGWGLPLFLERRNVALAALLTLVGAFLLRYFVVMAGQV